MMEMTPTPEQQAVIDAAKTGEDLVIQAGAGTGKTSTLEMVAREVPKSSLYVAYNKAIATDAASRFPQYVRCKTSHSLAFGAVGRRFTHRLNAARQPSWVVAKQMGLNHERLDTEVSVSPNHQARIAADTVRRFCYSADDELSESHVPFQNGITGRNHRMLQQLILPLATEWWADVNDTAGTMPFEHDHYLKMWALTAPDLGVDVVFLDEAQDSNPVLAKLVSDQDAQQIVVGDSCQQMYCQPVGTMVEVSTPGKKKAETVRVPIENLKAPDMVVTYHNSHVHKRGRPISSVTRLAHDGPLVRVTTETGLTSAYTPKHHVIVRAGHELDDKHVVYLMRRDEHFRIGRVPFRYRSQHGAFGPALRALAEGADAVWILSVHDTAKEAALAETLAQFQHNIPGARFNPTRANDVLDVRAFWNKVGDLTDRARMCLHNHGRLMEFPIWTRGRDHLVGIRRPFVTAATNLIDGFKVLPIGAEVKYQGKRDYVAPASQWVPVTVTHEWYTGDIVSLEVADHHTYYADGILTHNSWRGAVDALKGWGHARQLYLSQSWRFGQVIADEANKWLLQLPTPLRLLGNPAIDSELVELDAPRAVLCRTNGGAMGAVLRALEAGQHVALVGGGQALAKLAGAASDLRKGRRTNHPELYAFKDWESVVKYAREEASGRDLLPLVSLINEHGAERIIEATQALVNESVADVIVSTTHKANCLEWDSVKVAGDFFSPQPAEGQMPTVSESEAMVGYVAVTRAKVLLDRGGVSWIDDLVVSAEPEIELAKEEES